jgi:hypothetical protein
MGFNVTLVFWAIPAILSVGLAATLFAATRSRPGVQQGFRVTPRLRFVDAGSLGCHAVTQLVVMLFWVMLPWREFFQQRVAPFGLLVCGFAVGGPLVLALTTVLTRCTLRWLWRRTGFLTADQAKYYPLRANKLRMDAWPPCWQEPAPSQPSLAVQADRTERSAEPSAAPDRDGTTAF